MTMQLNAIETALLSGNKQSILTVIINDDALDIKLKALAMLYVNVLSENQARAISEAALEAIPYLRNGDIEGLKSFAVSKNVPAPMVEIIVNLINGNLHNKVK